MHALLRKKQVHMLLFVQSNEGKFLKTLTIVPPRKCNSRERQVKDGRHQRSVLELGRGSAALRRSPLRILGQAEALAIDEPGELRGDLFAFVGTR